MAVLWFVPSVYPGSLSPLNPLFRLLEAAHSVLICHFFYHYVIVYWGQTLVVLKEPIVWSVISTFRGFPLD